MGLLQHTEDGIYCSEGDFYIDPTGDVKTAIVTHAHADHGKEGHENYYTTNPTKHFLQHRIGDEKIHGKPFGKPFNINDVTISFYPAGHILGSAQVKIEKEETWIVTGDYNVSDTKATEDFQWLEADNLISEATFPLPIYTWEDEENIFDDMEDWIKDNKERGQSSILFGYSLGKAQRILAGLAERFDETIYLHGAVTPYNEYYENHGIDLGSWQKIDYDNTDLTEKIVVAPPNAYRSKWMKNFSNVKTAFCSGWMTVRGNKRRKGYDKGFALSDHSDWDDILRYVEKSGCKNVYFHHGDTDSIIRYVNEKKQANAHPLNEV